MENQDLQLEQGPSPPVLRAGYRVSFRFVVGSEKHALLCWGKRSVVWLAALRRCARRALLLRVEH